MEREVCFPERFFHELSLGDLRSLLSSQHGSAEWEIRSDITPCAMFVILMVTRRDVDFSETLDGGATVGDFINKAISIVARYHSTDHTIFDLLSSIGTPDLRQHNNLLIPRNFVTAHTSKHHPFRIWFDNWYHSKTLTKHFRDDVQFSLHRLRIPMSILASIRVNSGVWGPLPPSWKELPLPQEHYTHPSVMDPTRVSFYPTAEKLTKDVATVMRPGRYLANIFPHMSGAEIESLQAEFATGLDLVITSDPDEIEEVYVNGPRSCMSYCRSTFHTFGVHPVRAYAGGDLAVAYISKKGGGSSARCVVWPDRKLYSRIYGDTHRLGFLLRKNGYKYGELEGAKIKIIKIAGNRMLMPYLDSVGRVSIDLSSGMATISANGKYSARITCGYTSARLEPIECHLCEQVISDDDEVFAVGRDESVCQSCFDERYFYCRSCDSVVHNDEGGDELCQDCFDESYFHCSSCDSVVHNDDGDRDRELCQSCFDERYFYCRSCDSVVHNDDGVEVVTGTDPDIIELRCENCGDVATWTSEVDNRRYSNHLSTIVIHAATSGVRIILDERDRYDGLELQLELQIDREEGRSDGTG